MKVVHLSTTDYGGAYTAAVRISESMQRCGIDSQILIRTKIYDDTVGTEVFVNNVQKFISKAKNFINLLLSEGDIVSDYLGTDISKHPLVQAADVIILHWVNSFVSYKNIEQLVGVEKPVIWVLHDMWLLTGGCHYDKYCGKYNVACSDCQYVKTNWKKKLVSHNYNVKKDILAKLKPTLVMPSNWLCECAKRSYITKDLKKFVIPNPINEKEFYNNSYRELFLKYFNLQSSTGIILFGAMHATINPYKGFRYLKEALQGAGKKPWVLVVFGNDNLELEKKIGEISVIYLGMVNQNEKLSKIYNVADVFVAPSTQENYANSVLEAMSCGVPTVAFDVGGMGDLILHKETGYLAKYENTVELLMGIEYCIENRDRLSKKALEERKRYNSMSVVGEKYYQLCKSALEDMKVLRNGI